MSQALRIGIIGAGANTRLRHIPGFQALDHVAVVTIANRSPDSARKAAELFGVARTAPRWQDVIEDPEVDAICIGTWPNTHAEISLAALAAGKHVLTEARMARNLSEARRMLSAAKTCPDLVTQIVPAPFSLDYDATIQRLLPTLGQLREVVVTHRFAACALPGTPRTWRQNFDLSGVNTHTLGILYETVQRWLGPKVDPEWLIADAAHFTEKRPDPETDSHATVTIPDTVSVLGRYTGGIRFSYEISTVDSVGPVQEIRLNAEGGSLRFDLTTTKLWFAEPGSAHENEIPPDPETALGWRVEQDFVNSIRLGSPVTLTSFADGLRYMRFTEMVWNSWSHDSSRQLWKDYV